MVEAATSAGDFFRAAAGRGRSQRLPVSALFEITPTCNLRCHFCYVALDPYQGPYLSTEQACRVIDILEHAGILWLTLTGGEIFSRRDFPEIYAHAKRRGMLVTLYTNATMVTERIAAVLRDDPPFAVEVSIYGADAEHYEATTQIPGSFARFERGVRLLLDAGVPLTLKTPLSKFTQDHLPALVSYTEALGVPFKYDPLVDRRHDGDSTPTLYRISTKDMPAMADKVHEIRFGTARPAGGPLPECETEGPDAGDNADLYRCSAGRTTLFIDALGSASHCVIDREPTFQILEMPWQELWAQMGAWVTQPLPADAPCSGCGLRHECSNCPARSRLATGSPYLKDTYYCDVTHALHGLDPLQHPDYTAKPRSLGVCAS